MVRKKEERRGESTHTPPGWGQTQLFFPLPRPGGGWVLGWICSSPKPHTTPTPSLGMDGGEKEEKHLHSCSGDSHRGF